MRILTSDFIPPRRRSPSADRAHGRRRLAGSRRVVIPLVGLVALVLGSCDPKAARYFGPGQLFQPPPGPTDLVPPVIRNLQPSGNVFLNDQELCFEAEDFGTGASGINFPGIRATSAAGLSLPVRASTTTQNVYFIDIRNLPEGAAVIALIVPDLAGNEATATFVFVLDLTPPSATMPIGLPSASTGSSAIFPLTGTYSDLNGIGGGNLFVRQRQGNECSVNDPLFPLGTVSQNTYGLDPFAGSFNNPLTAYGPPDAQRPQVVILCVQLVVTDRAVSKFGTARPNTRNLFTELTHTWNQPAPANITGRVTVNGITPLAGVTVFAEPGLETTTDANGVYRFDDVAPDTYVVILSDIPPGVLCSPSAKSAVVAPGETVVRDFDCTLFDFTLGVEVRWVHVGPGVSFACAVLKLVPVGFSGAEGPLPDFTGATWTASWSGPGVVGSTQRSGTFDTNNEALDRQQINLFGTYTVNASATASGITKQVSGSVTVGGTQGTCPAP